MNRYRVTTVVGVVVLIATIASSAFGPMVNAVTAIVSMAIIVAAAAWTRS